MSKRHFNTDNPADVAELLRIHPPDRRFEFKKLTKYGSGRAAQRGLLTLEETIPDKIIPFDGIQEAIQHADEMKSWPADYLQRTWCPKGTRYSQGSIGFCWAFGAVGALMTCRAMEDKETELLAPISLGWLVNWRNEGNYLESAIGGLRDKGAHPIIEGRGFNDTTLSGASSRYPVSSEARKPYRLLGILDTNPAAGDKVMLCQTLTIMLNKCSGYEAWGWWGHATEHAKWKWTPGTYLNVTAVIHNSHDEDDFIELEGSKCIPDEFYGFMSTVPV